MKAEIVWMFIYDTGGEVDLRRVGDVLQTTPFFEAVHPRIAAPRSVELPRPLSVRLPTTVRDTTAGKLEFEAGARIYQIGAVAVTLRARVQADDFGRLREIGNLALLGEGGQPEQLELLARQIFGRVQKSIATAIIEEYGVNVEPERYAVYCVTEPPTPAGALLAKERRALAALLANEADPDRLAPEEVEDNLRWWYRYYEDDLVIVDWDWALVVEPSGKYEDTLFVLELANLQHLELRTYDAYLDQVLDRAYDDLSRFYKPGGIFRSARDLQEALSDARIDIIRVTDDINNIGKIFGDWYLAKLYVGITERFHLREWEQIVREKLQALNDVYTLASHEVEHRRAVLLEGLIVLLFVLDLVLLVAFAI